MIAQMQAGRDVSAVFLLADARLQRTGDDRPCLVVRLQDQSGVIQGRWTGVPDGVFEQIRDAHFVRVEAQTHLYRDEVQMHLHAIRPAPDDAYCLEDFLPRVEQDPEALMATVGARIQRIEQPHLRHLLQGILGEGAIRSGFLRAPAAVRHHHARVGGLIEHVTQMIRAADLLCDAYPRLNRDLLIAGVILHDLGKIWEIDAGRGFHYTEVGELIGHISLGVSLVVDRAKLVEGFPRPLLIQLQHLILSHHGEYEWGSPRRPMTAEALALHQLDNLDAKLAMYWEACDEAPHDTPFTGYVPALRRRMLRT